MCTLCKEGVKHGPAAETGYARVDLAFMIPGNKDEILLFLILGYITLPIYSRFREIRRMQMPCKAPLPNVHRNLVGYDGSEIGLGWLN